MTKILAERLNKTILKIIYSDQASFMKKRQIRDQIRLKQMMLNYAKAMEENRVIIVLD